MAETKYFVARKNGLDVLLVGDQVAGGVSVLAVSKSVASVMASALNQSGDSALGSLTDWAVQELPDG